MSQKREKKNGEGATAAIPATCFAGTVASHRRRLLLALTSTASRSIGSTPSGRECKCSSIVQQCVSECEYECGSRHLITCSTSFGLALVVYAGTDTGDEWMQGN